MVFGKFFGSRRAESAEAHRQPTSFFGTPPSPFEALDLFAKAKISQIKCAREAERDYVEQRSRHDERKRKRDETFSRKDIALSTLAKKSKEMENILAQKKLCDVELRNAQCEVDQLEEESDQVDNELQANIIELEKLTKYKEQQQRLCAEMESASKKLNFCDEYKDEDHDVGNQNEEELPQTNREESQPVDHEDEESPPVNHEDEESLRVRLTQQRSLRLQQIPPSVVVDVATENNPGDGPHHYKITPLKQFDSGEIAEVLVDYLHDEEHEIYKIGDFVSVRWDVNENGTEPAFGGITKSFFLNNACVGQINAIDLDNEGLQFSLRYFYYSSFTVEHPAVMSSRAFLDISERLWNSKGVGSEQVLFKDRDVGVHHISEISCKVDLDDTHAEFEYYLLGINKGQKNIGKIRKIHELITDCHELYGNSSTITLEVDPKNVKFF